jgi:hypothetical protein
MLKLSKENYDKAANYIMTEGRNLEKSLLNYYFKDGSMEEVLFELAKYQNDDGGFGHCIESDVRLEASNPFATSVAFQILSSMNIDLNTNLVKDGIKYLVHNYNPDFKGWIFFPPEVDEVPRAIWWNYDANQDNKYNCNPSAEIAGYIAKYSSLVPERIVSESLSAALEYLDSNWETLNMHDIFCYQRMTKGLSESKRELVIEKLKKCIPGVIEFNPDKWTGYVARPLSFIHSPSDNFASTAGDDIINVNLDYLINEQTPDGSWAPRWNWGRFHEEWKTAEKEWKGHITLENLSILKAFGRIED